MIITKKKLEQMEKDAEGLRREKQSLEYQLKNLKEELAETKHKKKLEEENIRHMVKIKEEALQIEFKKKEMDLEAKKNQEVAEAKDEYRDKLEGFLVKKSDDIKDMYEAILQRLPDVNVRLKG